MTVDEELTQLESQLRRLKIEYEVFFSNPQKKPPSDLEWKVLALLRKFSDGGRLSFSQRFRYNEMAQRYAIYSDLWRKKSRIREEGYRRPQDALLSVQGVRPDEHVPEHKVYGVGHATATQEPPFVVHCSDARAERDKRDLSKRRDVRYAVQLELACELETLQKAWNWDRPSGTIWLLTTSFHGRTCFRVLWGRYGSLAEAREARTRVPEFFTAPGNRPTIVSVR